MARSAHSAGATGALDLERTVGAAGIAECALSPLPRIDYADRFSMAPGVEASPFASVTASRTTT